MDKAGSQPDTSIAEPVSIVVPVHNERDGVGQTLRELQRVMTAAGRAFEIIAVDDGSTDGSAEIIAEIDGVRLLRHEQNRGYGASLKTGFAAARHALLAFLDADGSYPPQELPRLLEFAESAEMVVGDRVQYRDYSSYARTLGKRILHPLANYLVDRKIPDLNSGLRVVRRHLVDRYWPLLPDGFSLTTTLTMAFLSAGWRVKYVPIEFTERKGVSKIRPIRDMRNFIVLIVRTVTYFRPLKVYIPLSVLCVIASAAVVILSKLLTGKVMNVTSLCLFIAGMQALLIGIIADLVLKLLGTRE